jgi:hypothetical protein
VLYFKLIDAVGLLLVLVEPTLELLGSLYKLANLHSILRLGRLELVVLREGLLRRISELFNSRVSSENYERVLYLRY